MFQPAPNGHNNLEHIRAAMRAARKVDCAVNSRLGEQMEQAPAIDTLVEGDKATIRCAGALDLTNSQALVDGLKDATERCDEVVVDFVSVVFIDTAVLADLVVAARAMLRRDRRLKVLVADNTHPKRTLEIVGFSAIMDIETAG